MMRFISLAIFLFLLINEESYAQNMVGHWNVSGTKSNDDAYLGELNVKLKKNHFYDLNWILPNDLGDTSYQSGIGVYFKSKNELMVAYTSSDNRYGLFSYDLNEMGGLAGTGQWTSASGKGAELIGGKLGKTMLEGVYEIVGRRPLSDVAGNVTETYRGFLRITKNGDVFNLTWGLNDNVPYNGFGYLINNQLIGVWGIGKAYGIKRYKIDEYFKKGEGNWTSAEEKPNKFVENISRQSN